MIGPAHSLNGELLLRTQPASALEQIADRTARMTLATLPETVLAQARLCILDTVGCILAGTQTEEARLVLACHTGVGEVSVLGTCNKLGLEDAARVNGYLGDVLELNDLIGGHASIGIVTAALTQAQATHASGRTLLEAVVRGIEATWLVYSAVYPHLKPFNEMGLVPVGLPSSIGAAAAASHLLGLTEDQSRNALAIAGTLAGWCPAEAIFGNGGNAKPLLFGAQPAVAGLQAARYARQGMTGPPHLLDSKLGYYATVTRQDSSPELPPAVQWGLAQPRRKLHACCGYLHSPADALLQARRKLGSQMNNAHIAVRVAPYVADVVVKHELPLSANDARFHLSYMLAQVLGGADSILPQHSVEYARLLHEPATKAALGRITAHADPSLTHYHQCRLLVRAPDGRVLEDSYYDAPRGSPACPLSDDEVIAKFRRLARPVLGETRTYVFERLAQTLQDIPDAATFCEAGTTLGA